MAVTTACTVEAHVVMSTSCCKVKSKQVSMLVGDEMTYRLIDDTKSNLRVGLILRSKLAPKTG